MYCCGGRVSLRDERCEYENRDCWKQMCGTATFLDVRDIRHITSLFTRRVRIGEL